MSLKSQNLVHFNQTIYENRITKRNNKVCPDKSKEIYKP